MSIELATYTDDFLNFLADCCTDQIIVTFYLIEQKVIIGPIVSITESCVKLFVAKRIYIIPIKSIIAFSIEKEKPGVKS